MSQKKKFIISFTIIVFCVVGSYLLANYIVDEQQADLVQSLELKISEQDRLLTSLAEITKRGGADEVVATVVVDCSIDERQRFDQLLNSLSVNLTAVELRDLELLYNKCGSFFYDRRLVMTARLEREIVLLADYLDLLETLHPVSDTDRERLGMWQLLIESEVKTNQYYSTLVKLQGDIITALNNNLTPTSNEIKDILTEVTNTRNLISVSSSQSESYRQQLQTI